MSVAFGDGKKRHPLIDALRTMKGNQRACVLTEPLWGIPYNLFAPYVSLYMVALGLGDVQIGNLISIGLALQFFWALMSGAITDKLGRRHTTFLFDLLAWSVPSILWAVAQNVWYFVAASFFNAIWRVTANSWGCLLVEDGDEKKLISIYTLVEIMAFISGMFAPIMGLFIARYTLVPAMRVVYWLGFFMMTVKFVILFFASKEGEVGRQRMIETRGVSVFRVALGGFSVLRAQMKSPSTILSMLFLALLTCFTTVQGTFWPLFVSAKYAVSDAMLSLFPFIKTVVIMVIYFAVTPRLRPERLKIPLLFALGVHALWIILLLCFMPMGGLALPVVFVAAVIEAVAAGILGPLSNSMLALNVDAQERARLYSMAYALILAISTPAGWIAGSLSSVDRSLPLAFNLVVIAALMVIALLYSRAKKKATA